MALWDNPWSGADQAMADTLIRKATGLQFDQLAATLGAPRLSSVPQKYWRKALQHVAYGPRGAPGSTFAFLREALRQHDVAYTVSVDPAPLTQNQIAWVAGGPVAGFTHADLFRLWDINGVVYLSMGFGAAPGAPPWPSIYLVPYRGPHWRACDWSTDSTLIAGVATNRTAYRLPFTLKAVGATYKVFLDSTISIQPAPPTYIQETFDFAVAGLTSMQAVPTTFYPFRADQAEKLSGAVNGGTPNSALPTSNFQMFLLSEAITLKRIDFYADADPGVAAPNRGGDYIATLMESVGGGLFAPTALTVTLGDVDTHAFAVGAVPLAKGKLICIKVERGSPVVPFAPLQFPRIQVSGDRPALQPEGGFVLGGAQEVPGLGGVSPYPIYLNDPKQLDWTRAIDLLLAAGVFADVQYHDFNYPY